MIYKDLHEILDLLNDIKKVINKKDFDRIIREHEKDGKCKQIIDEWKYSRKQR